MVYDASGSTRVGQWATQPTRSGEHEPCRREARSLCQIAIDTDVAFSFPINQELIREFIRYEDHI